MSARRWLLIPLVVLLAAPSVLSAQSSVEARVQKLEEMIRVLEHKVADLESQLREQKTDAPVPAGKVTWRKLQKGMSESDVETLLGSPTKVDVFSTFTIWHYGEYPEGRVQFDGRSRTVDSWHEP